jgi:hypothetical protein
MSDPFGVKDEVRGFLSGGSLAAKFPKNGFTVEGTIVSYRMQQRTHIDSGEPLFWEGKSPTEESKLKFDSSRTSPANQLLIEVQGEPTGITWDTNRYVERAVPNDDGVRTFYVTGGLQKAVAKALRDSGASDLEKGAYLKVTKTSEFKRPGSKYFSFVFEAEYTPAKDNGKAAADFLQSPDGSEDEGENPFAD